MANRAAMEYEPNLGSLSLVNRFSLGSLKRILGTGRRPVTMPVSPKGPTWWGRRPGGLPRRGHSHLHIHSLPEHHRPATCTGSAWFLRNARPLPVLQKTRSTWIRIGRVSDWIHSAWPSAEMSRGQGSPAAREPAVADRAYVPQTRLPCGRRASRRSSGPARQCLPCARPGCWAGPRRISGV